MGRLFSTLSPQAIALPVGILTIIVLMVMPIPAFMLDAFFVFNIAMSVAVLMASMNAAKPLDFSSFPRCCCLPRCCVWRSMSPPPASCWSTGMRAARRRAM
jgi:flagellar biosynthesis component FlhA